MCCERLDAGAGRCFFTAKGAKSAEKKQKTSAAFAISAVKNPQSVNPQSAIPKRVTFVPNIPQ